MKLAAKVAYELKEIAIDYHVRTEMGSNNTIELQHAYLAASKFGVEGMLVRKMIAEVVEDNEIKRRLKELNKYKNPEAKGQFLHEQQKQYISIKSIHDEFRHSIGGVAVGIAAGVARISKKLRNRSK